MTMTSIYSLRAVTETYEAIPVEFWAFRARTSFNPFMTATFAVRETASLGIMGAPRVPPLNPSESIVLSE